MKPASKTQLWTGRILSAIPVLFLTMDGVMKFTSIKEVTENTANLGYSLSVLPVLGTLTLVGVALYLVPRTSVLGAIWLTGYLGGAVATHVRVDHPLFSHVLFPTYLGLMLWTGLLLRNPRLRVLLNPQSASSTPVESTSSAGVAATRA